MATPLDFGTKPCLSPWPSGLRRQSISDHLVKNWGGVRGKNFFFFFSKFDLRSNFVFSLFFKPYGTFSMIYMAIFFKMAPLNGYEPTVIWSFFTLSYVDFSPKIKIQDLQNDKNCSFIQKSPLKNCQISFDIKSCKVKIAY